MNSGENKDIIVNYIDGLFQNNKDLVVKSMIK